MSETPNSHQKIELSRLKQAIQNLSAKTAQGKRWRAAMAVALVSDAVSLFLSFAPPLQITVDLGTAALMLLCLRWRWAFLIALFPEALPGFALFPFWVLVIATLAAIQPLETNNE